MTEASGTSGQSHTYLEVTTNSQDTAKNTSSIHIKYWSVSDTGYAGFSGGTGWAINVVNGGGQDQSGTKSFNSTTVVWGEYDTTVTHNSDGTLTVQVVGDANDTGTQTFGNPPQLTVNHALPTIARASQPTVSGTTDAGSVMTISTNRKSTSFTHTLSYNFGGAVGVVIATGVTDTYAWTVPMALLNQIPNNEQGTGSVICATYSGSSLVGTKTVGITISAGSGVVPTISTINVSDSNATVAAAIGGFVQGQSALNISLTSAGVYGSTIVTQSVTFDSNTLNTPTTSPPIVGTGSLPVVATVTDSRGRVATLSGSVNVLAYSLPTATNVTFRRANSAGTLDESGTYVRVDATTVVSSLIVSTEKNTLTWTLQTSTDGGTWTPQGSWTGTVPTFNTNELGSVTIPVTESRQTQLIVSDKLNTVIVGGVISTESVALSLAQGGIGVGKVWENGTLDVGGDVYMSGIMQTGSVPAARLTGVLADAVLPARLQALPDPQTIFYDGDCTITATASGTAVPNLGTISITATADMWVDLRLKADLIAAAGDMFANIVLTGATVSGWPLIMWGNVIYQSAANGTAVVQSSTVQSMRLLAGTTVVSVESYRSGSGSNIIRRPVLEVVPLRWA